MFKKYVVHTRDAIHLNIPAHIVSVCYHNADSDWSAA